MEKFIAIIHKEKGSDYGVSFPDFIGCVTAGRTIDEAIVLAQEALRGHIEVMHEHGDALPSKPLTLEQARKNKLAKGADAFVYVEAPLPVKPLRVNVMLDANVLQRIDRVSKNRSAFLNAAARQMLDSGMQPIQLDNSAI